MSTLSIARTQEKNRLKRIRFVASLMDSQFNFLGIKYGLDSIIGLIPGAGDVVAGLISAYIIWEAHKIGVPKETLAKMVTNVMVDVFIGGIPVLGDIFDVAFKANRRNVAMVEEFLAIG